MSSSDNQKYQELLKAKIDKLNWDFIRYSDTVLLLYSLWKFLHKKIPIEVEPTKYIPELKRNVTPDIIIYRSIHQEDKLQRIPTVIIDYKWSLKREDKYIIDELNEMTCKYSKINNEAEVMVLIPEENCEKIKQIMEQLDQKLIIWSVELNIEKRRAKFRQIRGIPNDMKFIKLLEQSKYSIPLDIPGTSRYAFIRETPPEPYAALKIWNVITTVANTLELYDTSEYVFKFKEIQNEVFFPPWISIDENIDQLKQRVFNKAIRLLEYAGFVKIDWNKKEIKAFLSKGKGIHDLKDYLIRKAAQKTMPKLQRPKKEGTKKEKQTSLNGWFKK